MFLVVGVAIIKILDDTGIIVNILNTNIPRC